MLAWRDAYIPGWVGGGPNSAGAEVLAALVEGEFQEGKYVATLDLSHAFDTVDAELVVSALCKLVSPDMRGWVRCLGSHWMRQVRWLCYNAHVHEVPVISATGVPQGDPASPLALARGWLPQVSASVSNFVKRLATFASWCILMTVH